MAKKWPFTDVFYSLCAKYYCAVKVKEDVAEMILKSVHFLFLVFVLE